LLGVAENTGWVNAWVQGSQTTGYVPVDRLVDTWKLKVRRMNLLQSMNEWMAELESGTPLNIKALSRQFVGLDGILHAEPNGLGGDGADITGEHDADGVTLRFSVGWGDCPSGCIHRHTWTFHVGLSGTVSLVSITGSSLP
jgi:hypothetical protein